MINLTVAKYREIILDAFELLGEGKSWSQTAQILSENHSIEYDDAYEITKTAHELFYKVSHKVLK